MSRIFRRFVSDYPFASSVKVSTSAPARPTIDAINAHAVESSSSSSPFVEMFSRRAKDRIRPGSVLSVTSYNSMPTTSDPTPSTSTFSGVLIGVRRRNAHVDTSIRLRQMLGKTGVETSYKVMSPLIKSIEVVQRATRSGPVMMVSEGVEGQQRRPPTIPALRRAKGYFLRDQNGKMPNVTAFVKQARDREARSASGATPAEKQSSSSKKKRRS